MRGRCQRVNLVFRFVRACIPDPAGQKADDAAKDRDGHRIELSRINHGANDAAQHGADDSEGNNLIVINHFILPKGLRLSAAKVDICSADRHTHCATIDRPFTAGRFTIKTKIRPLIEYGG